jgi:hypothetical protein
MPEIKYYVSLDLGSESTAAYYEEVENPQGGMIYLQEHATALVGIEKEDGGWIEADYFMDDEQNRSPRLRTFFFVDDGRQPFPLPDAHAELDFIGPDDTKLNYEDSLLKYFRRGDQDVLKVLPNPKIPFQEGAVKVIPEVTVKPDNKVSVRFEPLVLIQHMTTQIIRNFILKSKPLRNAKPEQVHLLLTVPNVYSLTHIEDIRTFVQARTGIAKVEALYESDAVAYSILVDRSGTDLPDIKEFKDQYLKRKNKEELRILTIDVGRGTTDLSLMQIKTGYEEGVSGDRQPHFILARTGKSDGGNQLSYLLATYYNERLEETFRTEGHLINKQMEFSFVAGLTPMHPNQRPVLFRLQLLIEKMKRHISKDYEVELSRAEQIDLIDPLIDQIFTALAGTTDKEEQDWNTSNAYKGFRKKLQDALYLPGFPGRWKTFWHKTKRGSGITSQLIDLKQKLRDYVQENIISLVDQLEIMAASRENMKNEKYIIQKESTFVVVAGQASQFRPIKAAIEQAFDNLNLPKENILYLTGAAAKEACCRGAISFKKSFNEPMNSEELHGTYGFLNANPGRDDDVFKPIDMAKLNQAGEYTVTFRFRKMYYLVYSPRVGLTAENAPVRLDGLTAIIKAFPEEKEFHVKYDRQNASLIVNGTKVAVATFGDINQDIYPKVWPEVVRPLEKRS